ncbi:MAG TPA: septal ring lytic transglycosylase RlpA family protein [Pseudolabrys sp.]|nr:septal ring lytic transglycosylase RlpA family protein [Pseudolabrys sp.]
MGGLHGDSGLRRPMRILVLIAGCLALANCAKYSGRIDPRYGVASSERVIPLGQPVPKGGGYFRVGDPYVIAGRTYVPREDVNYSAVGYASWYGDDFHGRYTANHEIFDENAISAAHPTLPLPSYVRVTNLKNHRSIVVRVNDRGPYVGDRLIDVSVRTAKLLGFYGHGLAKVKVDYIGRAPLAGSDDRKLEATLREGTPDAAPINVASAKPYVPASYFSSRRITDVPAPPERPFKFDESTQELSATTGRSAVERQPLTSVAQAQSVPARASLAGDEPVERLTSPVSAYSSGRPGAGAGFMSGRGLY